MRFDQPVKISFDLVNDNHFRYRKTLSECYIVCVKKLPFEQGTAD